MEAQVNMTINNIKYIDKSQYDDVIFRKEQFYEQWMLTCIKKLGYLPGVWIDVGAHVGNHTIYFSKHCGADEVWAYEPTKETFAVLEENVKNNCKNTVRLFNCAVGSKVGFCKIKKNDQSGENHIVYGSGKIPVVVLGDIVAKVALIKIDVEGFEFEVLKGALPIIERDKPELFIETFEDKSKIEELLPKGYKFIQQYNNAPTYHYSCK